MTAKVSADILWVAPAINAIGFGLAGVGAVVGDPAVFAIKDRVSWLAFALAGVAAFLAV
jgi:hypothetical protein